MYVYIYTYNYAFSSSEEGALKRCFPWTRLFPLRRCGSLTMAYFGKSFYSVYYKLIIDNDEEITTLNLLLQVLRDQNPQGVICKY